jgi:hypothetical protein
VPGHELRVEIACDESGSEGGKLVGGTTDVLAHASVVVDRALAAACLDEVRLRARSPAEEVKASVVLRVQNRAVLRDLLGPAGPFWADGAPVAHVHLVEKRYLLVVRFLALLGLDGPDDPAPGDAHRALDRAWDGVLTAFNDLLRARERATLLDPLAPALAAVVAHWSRDCSVVVDVVHDEHRTLRESGPARLHALCASVGLLGEVRFVDSRDDARVNLADFLAGTARRVASEVLAGRVDDDIAELADLVRPFVGVSSTWGDPVSWALLAPRVVASR